MAQVAQEQKATRNTKKIRVAPKNRNWCITINNYTTKEIEYLQDFDCEYVFQEEKGTEGTPHLQGVLMWKNAVSFNSVKKLLPRAHIEPCKNKMASINYCSKEETRTGQIYTNLTEDKQIWNNGTRGTTTFNEKNLDHQKEQNMFDAIIEADEFLESEEGKALMNKLDPMKKYMEKK